MEKTGLRYHRKLLEDYLINVHRLSPLEYLDFSSHYTQADQGNLEVRREPGLVSISAGKEVFLGQVSLILPDVHVIKLCCVAGLYFDLLGHFSAGIDPVAIESSEDAIEAALFNLVPARQTLDHLPEGVRIFQMHVKRRKDMLRLSFRASLAAPEFHAALEVRVEYPHASSPQRPWLEPASPKAAC
jgi:hypothetical protein